MEVVQNGPEAEEREICTFSGKKLDQNSFNHFDLLIFIRKKVPTKIYVIHKCSQHYLSSKIENYLHVQLACKQFKPERKKYYIHYIFNFVKYHV